MFGNSELKQEHFDKAAEMIAAGNCVIGNRPFKMNVWASCFYGTAYFLATGKLTTIGPEDTNGEYEQQLRWLFELTALADIYVARIYGRLDPTGKRLDLSGLNLHRANLIDANLAGVDFRGTDLGEAILVSADLTEAKYDDNTKFPYGFNPEFYDMMYCE